MEQNNGVSTSADPLSELMAKTDRRYIVVFVSGIISGLITHMYMLTHKLPNWDDVNNFGGAGVSRLYGRWFLDVLHPLGGTFSNPWINGFLAILLISLACVVMYRVTGMKSYTAAVLLPCIMMTFPSLGGTMFFMFTVDLYSVGILFSVLGVYVLTESKFRESKFGKWRFPLGFLLFLLTLGTYQSYICFSIALLLFSCILMLDGKGDTRAAVRAGSQYCGVLLATIIVYVPLSFFIEPNMRTEGQNGLENMSSNMHPAVLAKQFLRTYKRVTEFFVTRPVSYVDPFNRTVNILVVLILLLLVLALAKRVFSADRIRGMLFLAGWFLMPPAIAFFYVMSPNANYSSLMYYQYCLVYIFLIRLWETGITNEVEGRKNSLNNSMLLRGKDFVRILTPILVLLAAYCSFLVTVSAYFRMELAFGRVLEYYNRLYYTLENTPGFETGDPYTFMGDYWQKGKPSPLAEYSLDDKSFEDFSGMALEYGLLTSGARREFMRIYLGVGKNYQTWRSVLQPIEETEEYKEMPIYPEAGCVRKINDVWVLKMG